MFKDNIEVTYIYGIRRLSRVSSLNETLAITTRSPLITTRTV